MSRDSVPAALIEAMASSAMREFGWTTQTSHGHPDSVVVCGFKGDRSSAITIPKAWINHPDGRRWIIEKINRWRASYS